MSGKRIEHYILLEELAKCKKGIVYSSVHDVYNKLYAVKCLPIKGLTKEDFENLKKELNIMNKFDHPNIVCFKNYQRTKNNLYIMMELCNGGDLKTYIKNYFDEYKRPLNEFFIQKIIKQIVQGIKYLHGLNIIHRDIKLEKILLNFNSHPNIVMNGVPPPKLKFEEKSLSKSLTVKICGFGCLKELKENLTSTVIGNMAPEMEKGYNASVDLWSLGLITYELLTNTLPFTGKTEKETIENIKSGMYSLPNSLKCSLEIISFINGLLQYYPEKRLNLEQIEKHPFLKNDVNNFTFIDMQKLSDQEKDQIEINSKESDNLLWIFYKCGNLNMKIDKINQNEIEKPEVKKMLEKNDVSNNDAKKASEEEEIQKKKEKQKFEEMQAKAKEEIEKEELNNKEAQKRQEILNNEENDIKKQIENNQINSSDKENLEKKLEKNKKEKEDLNKELENNKKKITQNKNLFQFAANLLNNIKMNEEAKAKNEEYKKEIEQLKKQLEEEKTKNSNKEVTNIENKINDYEMEIDKNNNLPFKKLESKVTDYDLNDENKNLPFKNLESKEVTYNDLNDGNENEINSDEEDDSEIDFEDYLDEGSEIIDNNYIENKFNLA